MKKIIFTLLITVMYGSLISCSTEPEAINYGHDACHFCEMTIVSQAHAAQAVSVKGKQFKYDAIECMVNDINKNQTEMAVEMVSNFMQPGTMIPAQKAHFIINDSINSPMGANLAAIKLNSHGDPDGLYTWKELKNRFLEDNNLMITAD
ncbi:MAG: nitrous oxide reductase accessory protein NosL [Gillisia sp.]